MSVFKLIQSDYRKYKKYGAHSLAIIFLTQGFWAVFQYRIANSFFRLKIPIIRPMLLILCLFWQKKIEIITGISIPYSASIGNSFYIGHFGNIIINANAVIGNNCNISQGVTIGVSGRREKRGVPILGNNIYMGANAVIAGNIKIGDNAVIGANSLVVKSVEKNTTVVGVPAEIVSNNTSKEYI